MNGKLSDKTEGNIIKAKIHLVSTSQLTWQFRFSRRISYLMRRILSTLHPDFSLFTTQLRTLERQPRMSVHISLESLMVRFRRRAMHPISYMLRSVSLRARIISATASCSTQKVESSALLISSIRYPKVMLVCSCKFSDEHWVRKVVHMQFEVSIHLMKHYEEKPQLL